MTIPVSIEKMETRWIAYAAGLPGCFSSSEDRDAAAAGIPAELCAYLDWSARHGEPLSGVDVSAPVEIREIIAEWVHPGSGEAVNAFFAADVPPLTTAEIARDACLFDWTRADLLEAIAGLAPEILDRPVVGDWSIGGIFYHTTRGDWWYLRALGLAPSWSASPKNGLPALLDWTQSLILAALPGLVDQTRVESYNGELWSPRKFLRRALWHRRDHTAHIHQFRAALGL